MNPLEYVKEHPKLAAGVAIVTVLVVWFAMRGGGTTATSISPDAVVGGTAMQDQLSGLQQATLSAQYGLQAQAESDDTAVQIAKLQLEGQNNNQQTAQLSIVEQAQTQQYVSMLSAGVAQAQVTAQQQESIATTSAQVSMNATNQATQAQIVKTMAGVQQSAIAAQQKIATQSLFSKLFG